MEMDEKELLSNYGQMTDEELIEHYTTDKLSDLSHDVLQAEFKRRHIDPENLPLIHNPDKKIKSNKNKGVFWKISLTSLLIGLLFSYFLSGFISPPLIIGQAVGYALAILLMSALFSLIWRGIRYLANKREPVSAKTDWIIFFATVSLLVLAQINTHFLLVKHQKKSEEEAKEFTSNIRNIYSDMVEKEQQMMEELDPEIDVSIEQKPQTKGRFSELEGFIRSFLQKKLELNKEYLGKMTDIGWLNIVDPSRLEKDVSGNETRFLYKQALSLIKIFRIRELEFLEQIKQEAKTLSVPKWEREDFIKKFTRELEQKEKKFLKMWEFEKKVATGSYQLAIYLAKLGKSNWTFDEESGQWLFDTDEQVVEFNRLMEGLTTVIDEQEKFEASIRVERDKKIQALPYFSE